jgi:hypothetical protein
MSSKPPSYGAPGIQSIKVLVRVLVSLKQSAVLIRLRLLPRRACRLPNILQPLQWHVAGTEGLKGVRMSAKCLP